MNPIAQAPEGRPVCIRRWLWWGVRGWLSVYHRLEVHGREHLPRAASFVLACNHASHLDTFVLAAALPSRLRERLVPLAAEDVFFRTAVRAQLAAGLLGAQPLARARCGAQRLRGLRDRLLAGPCVYILFPEGTRTRTGNMAPFKDGVGALVAGTSVPVVPCHLEGTRAALAVGMRLPRPRAVVLRIGSPLSFAEVDNDRHGWRQVSERVEAAVRWLGGGRGDPPSTGGASWLRHQRAEQEVTTR